MTQTPPDPAAAAAPGDEARPDPAGDQAEPDPASDGAAAAQAGTGARPGLIWVVLGVAAGIVALDQLTKWWALTHLRPLAAAGDGAAYSFLGGLLRLTYTENTGAAFSIGTGYTWIFTAIAVVVIVVIIRTSRSLGSLWWAIALGGLLGGAVGNLIDRLVRPPGAGQGHVIDWIQLPNFPVFNVADMCITGSAVLMVVLSLRGIDYDGPARARARA